jgi:hypothetical protein
VLGTLHLKPKTAETYASLLRSRILPTFGTQRSTVAASVVNLLVTVQLANRGVICDAVM